MEENGKIEAAETSENLPQLRCIHHKNIAQIVRNKYILVAICLF
jgi:hypothetical protein